MFEVDLSVLAFLEIALLVVPFVFEFMSGDMY